MRSDREKKMNLFSSVLTFLLIASSTHICNGEQFDWPMGSYEDVHVEVGDKISLDCGNYDQPKTLIEFYNKRAFRKCDTSRAAIIDNTGEITFAEEGMRYFGCGDCGDGMKLKVTVEPKGFEPETYGKKKFVITKGAQCSKGKVLARIKNKYVKACYFICSRRKDCHGFMHRAVNDRCILYGEPTYPAKRFGGCTCGWKAGDKGDGQNEGTHDKSEYSMYDTITVNVSLTKGSTSGGKVKLNLFLYDTMLADAPATLVTEYLVNIPKRAKRGSVPFTLYIDPSKKQLGKTFDMMINGAYYISLGTDGSDLTYADGPVFGIAPGETVSLELKNSQ